MSRKLSLRQDSLVYVKGTLTTDHDITGLDLFIAMPLANRAPASSDFVAAEVTGVVQDDEEFIASYRILVGPGGTIEKGAGLYDWTVKLTDSPEVPVFKAGQVQVTVT